MSRKELLAEIDRRIAAAPPENPAALRERAATIRRSKNLDGNARDEENREARFRQALLVERSLKGTGTGQIMIKAGQVTYTLWNTRENLQAFRKRVATRY